MTKLVYFSSLFRNYNNGEGLINSLERPLITEIIENCRPSDMFINSTWIEDDSTLNYLLDQSPERLIVYSGMDWHDNFYRKSVHDKLRNFSTNIKYIGNTDGEYYFSFWLFFIEKHFSKLYTTTPSSINIDKLFMCLNRKRHHHRVNLIDQIYKHNLNSDGLISLGGSEEISPILLPLDVEECEGNNSAAHHNEGILNDINSLGHKKNWERYFVNVVTETTVSSNTFISEKTWKPILGLKPFLILGDRNIYSYLKEYGFDTFDDIFGTGYNNPTYEGRIEWIVSTLKMLQGTDYNRLYKDILPRLQKNRDNVINAMHINKSRYKNVITTIN